MKSYKIERWDIIMGNRTFKSPIIYIKPDLDFLEFARSKNFAIMATVDGTGLIYDGKPVPGIVKKACSPGNCGPNFSQMASYYIIALNSNSYGYPNPTKLGTVSFEGLGDSENSKDENQELKSLSNENLNIEECNKSLSKEKKKNIGIIVGLIILFLLLCILSKLLYDCKNK